MRKPESFADRVIRLENLLPELPRATVLPIVEKRVRHGAKFNLPLAQIQPGQVTAAQGAPAELDSGDWKPARLRVFNQQGQLIAIAEPVVPRTYQPVRRPRSHALTPSQFDGIALETDFLPRISATRLAARSPARASVAPVRKPNTSTGEIAPPCFAPRHRRQGGSVPHKLRAHTMGRTFLAAFLASVWMFVGSVRAQAPGEESLRQGTWDLGIFAGGGNGLFAASDARYFLAGGRIGRVLTQDHVSGWARGNFEYATDFAPAFVVLQQGRAVYGGNFTPVMLVWNFTAARRIVPYILLSGGGLVTSDNVPPGNTSNFNFVGGGSFGLHAFLRPGRALTFETHWVHISNANLGRENPQLVSNFLFTVGYTWFK